MLANSKIVIFIYICIVAAYLSLGFLKFYGGFCFIFIDPQLHIKPIAISVAYLISTFAFDYFPPDYLKKYNSVCIFLSLGIVMLFVLRKVTTTRSNLGDLLFASQRQFPIPKIYLIVPFALVYIWVFSRIWKKLAGKTIYATTDVGGVTINSYLYHSVLIFYMLSTMVYAYFIISWNKLEIREDGTWYTQATLWKNIVDRSWEEDKGKNILVIKQINGLNKEIEVRYKISFKSKERVDKIFQDKLSSSTLLNIK